MLLRSPGMAEDDRRHGALIQAGLALASELSLPAVLQKIVDLACEVADARYGALGVLDQGGEAIEDFITHGITAHERQAIGDLPRGKGILGVLIEEAHPLRLTDLRDDPRSVGFPPNHPPMTTFLGVPVKVRGHVFGNLYLTEKRGGGLFTGDDEQAVMTLAVQAGIAIENARLYEASRRHTRRLEALNEVTHATLEGHDVEELLRLIAERAREIVGAAVASIVTPHEVDGRTILTVRAAAGAMSEKLAGATAPAEGSISQQVMETGTPLMIPDLSLDPRKDQPIVATGRAGPGIFVPLGAGDRMFGTLLVANLTGGRSFAEEDFDVVGIFAAQAAVAVEYARFREELSRLAVLEDRERIAKDLHDGVIQSLFAVGMSLQAAEAVAGDAETIRSRLGSAAEGIDGVIRDLRNYIFGLRPGAAADRTLERGIQELADTFRSASGTTIVVDVDPTAASLVATRAGEVVQAAREGLSNAIRHATAETVRISLARLDREIALVVADDGTGFDLGLAQGQGEGLANLAARATALRGTLEIETGEAGTTVRIRMPV